jgi:hypothetical protein
MMLALEDRFMRRLLIASAAVLAALLTAAAAPPGSSPLSPATLPVCLDVNGQTRPATCYAHASRLDGRVDICLCEVGQQVDAPVCGPGEKPQAETRAFERARRDAGRDGSLVGDAFDGRAMCVAPRNG